MSRLERVVPVDIVRMPDSGDAKYAQMTRYHRQGALEANGAPLIFLTPEHVLATNTLKRIVELRDAGYRAVVGPALRLVWEAVTATNQHAFTPRQLVATALQHLHPVSRNHFLTVGLPHYPTHVYWEAPGGLLAHCLNVYPYMVAPATKRISSPSSSRRARSLTSAPAAARSGRRSGGSQALPAGAIDISSPSGSSQCTSTRPISTPHGIPCGPRRHGSRRGWRAVSRSPAGCSRS